jgi:DNA modification methylase
MPTLQFKGKSFVQNHHLTVKYHELIPVPEKSLTDRVRLDDNLIIHGDNLVALKALLPMYAGRVKCIYIDPPYNTGEERWVYNDNVNSPMIREWLGNVVDKDDLTRHDKWLCMMFPRLQLLYELLSDNGFIFVSIDHFEIAHLRPIMDEIFGSQNHRNTIAVRRGIKNVQAQFKDVQALSTGHEYVLMYSKRENIRIPKLGHKLTEASNGKWDTFWRGTDRPTMRYLFLGQSPETGQWRWEETRAQRAYENYQEYLNLHQETGVSIDDYYLYHLQSTNEKLDFVRLNDDNVVQYYVPPRDVRLMSDNWMDITISGSETPFNTEKSVGFVQRIVRWICNRGDELILDSFAGSGTTAHAVLSANHEDNGHRKFILIEMEDYADSLTATRVRRTIRGSSEAINDKQRGLGGTFSYFEVGQAIEPEGLLSGAFLPSYQELARYVFYNATGEEFCSEVVDESRWFVGESREYEVYLLYRPDIDALKTLALNLDFVQQLGKPTTTKKRLVFAPARYLTDHYMEAYRMEYAQLPYEMYRTRR